jgi:DNA-binding response OmpR family regulator
MTVLLRHMSLRRVVADALAAEARRRWPGVAVVVMTGNEGNLVQMADDLHDECFLKPFNPPKLVAAVTSLMRRSQEEAGL